tara:strand:- start:266 stop:370 length:105 start_codon:yes stop_codon:yes gene_type:complete
VVRDDLPKLNTTINWPVKIQMLKQKKPPDQQAEA